MSSAGDELVDAVSARGDVVFGGESPISNYARPARLRTAAGGVATVPAQWRIEVNQLTGLEISQTGAVAFTLRADRRVHFFSCH